jgi:hypothetical protein
MWVTHVEIYKTIGASVDPAAIKGMQRVRSMWRIYMDNEIDSVTPDSVLLLKETGSMLSSQFDNINIK